jgi:hypothetical protein
MSPSPTSLPGGRPVRKLINYGRDRPRGDRKLNVWVEVRICGLTNSSNTYEYINTLCTPAWGRNPEHDGRST